MTKLNVKSRYKTEMIDLTDQINEEIVRSGVNASAINIFSPHSTCSVFVCENKDPNIQRDLLKKLHEFFPSDGRYAHIGGNGDAHMKASLMGSNVTIPVENAKMLLGPWQGLFFVDFDGPRDREAFLTLLQ
ncbi:MAG: secondary thiamine-phosphate synthase enzyme YjbQ [Helicobacteraceae bacterium]|nr:secondary thiamine-phosphate synthase enzyme YjbQ [Helicobacteraceae bacterium]